MFDAKILRAVILGATALGVKAAAAENDDLTVHASGFRHAGGHAVAKLFSPGDNVLGRGRWQLMAAIQDGQADFRFAGLSPGSYALVVFHDENDNGRIDHNPLRLPSEALGFSNGFSPGLLTGLPSFDKLRFEHATGIRHLDVTVK